MVTRHRRAEEVRQEARVRRQARPWSAASGVPLGGPPQVHDFDPARARAMLDAKCTAAEEA